MKKMLLLAGVASVFAFNANAMEMKPQLLTMTEIGDILKNSTIKKTTMTACL